MVRNVVWEVLLTKQRPQSIWTLSLNTSAEGSVVCCFSVIFTHKVAANELFSKSQKR